MASDPVAESWWERNRQVIRNLNLKYPTASELRKLATLAQVKSRKRFGDHIESIILDAHLNHSALNTLTVPKVRETLQGKATSEDVRGPLAKCGYREPGLRTASWYAPRMGAEPSAQRWTVLDPWPTSRLWSRILRLLRGRSSGRNLAVTAAEHRRR
jgi:hypothetical protein